MKAWVDELLNEKTGLQMAPLIDVVFLLLIYFMVSSSLKRSEADLGLSLPGQVKQSETIVMPDEQVIEVRADGVIVFNDREYTDPSKADLAELEQILLRFREASQLVEITPYVTIAADNNSIHERVIDVLNACAGAGIKNVTFANLE